MLNYGNLNDNEFENLCKDIMSKKLGKELRKFAPGKDGGIDLVDDLSDKNIIVQVKHYTKTTNSGLIASLRKELPKVKKLKPKQYYVCCSKELTPENIAEIYDIFKDYMKSDANIVTLTEIDEFLNDESNIEILKRHYKLWIESTSILKDILTNDICIDCEALLYDIESDVKFFVQTSAYQKALNCLSKNNVIFIMGDPGVGKTTTSKMLILYYASLKYKVRYTTDGTDLSALKKALSQSPETKEVVLLDDCLGQAYFNMKETQGNELIALIKYINMHPNKLLILNSRVTIYKEAQVRNPGLVKSLEKDEYKLHIINMSEITYLEKAQILYNHLYFNNVEEAYFKALKENRNYMRIISHRNYNPRIIEFVCAPTHFSHVSADKYVDFVFDNLNQPFQIWKNEYEERLSPIDRMLLTTLYSLSNTIIPLDLLQKCFVRRVESIPGIDLSVNQFERSVQRLERAFIKIVDYRSIKMISVSNPSINDFLEAYLSEDPLSYKKLLESSCSIMQLKRLLDKKSFLQKVNEIFEDGSVRNYCFESEAQKYRIITYYVSELGIKKPEYEPYVKKYVSAIKDVDIYEKQTAKAIDIFRKLMDVNIRSFYKLDAYIIDFTVLNTILEEFLLPDLMVAISCIDPLFVEDREDYVDLIKGIVKEAIKEYCSDIYADEYDFYIDLETIIENCTYSDSDGEDIDEWEASQTIEEEIRELVSDEIIDYLSSLPKDIMIDEAFIDKVDMSIYGCDDMVSDFIESNRDYDVDDWRERGRSDGGADEIDLIFNR